MNGRMFDFPVDSMKDAHSPKDRSLLPPAILLLLITSFSVPAVFANCLEPETDRPKIGLVLGGGGARGSAHIGVIRVLEEMNIPVDCVAGTSIGSLVAALYAIGMDADELEEVMLGLDWDDLFVDDTDREDQPWRRKRDDDLALFLPKIGIGKGSSLIKKGAISGQKISFLFESLVKERVQVEDFNKLPIPFRAIAADIATGKEVVMAQGDLAVAMRASMSVPGVFSPVEWRDHMLVDGGIVNNVPVDVVRDMGAEILIVVDVGSGLSSADELTTALAIVAQLSNIMIQSNTDIQIASLTEQDILITPPLGDKVTSAGFAKIATGIAIGFAAADAARPTLARLAVSESDYFAHRASISSRVTPSPTIQFVKLDNKSRFDDSVILERLTIQEGEPLNIEALDNDIREIYALGFMDLVRYEVVEEGGQSGIVVHAGQDSRGTQLMELGLDYFGDSDGSSINLRVGYLNTAIDSYGSELRITTQVGESPAMFAYLYKYLNPRLKIYLEPRLFAEQAELTSYDSDGDALLKSEVTQYGGSIAIGRELGRMAAVSIGVRAFSGNVEEKVGPPGSVDFDFDGGEYFANVAYDRMNDRYFPGDGAVVSLRYSTSSESLGADAEYDQFQTDAFYATTFGKHSLLGGLRYYETLDDEAPLYAQFRAGGFGRLSGYHQNELVGQHFAMVLGGYRYQFAGSGLLPAYLGGTLEYGRVAEDASDLFDDGLFNGSVYLGYRSPIGPLYMGMGFAEGGRERFFLSIGNVFGSSSLGR